jgi:hypothetical protein
VKPYRATIDFCFAANDIEGAAQIEDRLIEAAERLGIFFEYASTGEMTRDEVQPGSALAEALARSRADAREPVP